MTQMVNALGHKTKYQYDELNRLLMETDPQGYVQQYRYDAVGNRVWSKDPNGTESVYQYYPNNLVEKVTLDQGFEDSDRWSINMMRPGTGNGFKVMVWLRSITSFNGII